MNKKILTKLLVLLICFSLFPAEKMFVDVNAATSKTVIKSVGTWNGVKTHVENPTWEIYTSGKYGTWSDTLDYNDGTYEGTLKAVKIKATPLNKKEEIITGRTSPILTATEVKKVDVQVAAPKFSNTVQVSYKDTVANETVTGNIRKDGDMSGPVSTSESVEYISWGRANNYDVVNNSYYGLLRGTSNELSGALNQDWTPSYRFYGNLSVLANSTNAYVNTTKSYRDPLTGDTVTGIVWADKAPVDSNVFKNAYIGTNTDLTSNINKYGYQVLNYEHGVYRFRSERAVTYKTTALLNMRGGPGTSFDVKTQLPKGTIVEKTRSTGGWSFVLYKGVGGWVSDSYLAVHTDNGGANNHRFRRGITLLYDLIRYHDTYEQKYSGRIPLSDVKVRDYSDKWSIEIEYTGTVSDIRQNDIKVNSFSASPATSEIPYGDSSGANNLTFTYELEQTHTGTYADATVSPKVEIYQGTNATPIYSGSKTLNKASKKTFTTKVDGVNISSGSNTFKIHVNREKTIVERSLTVSDIYANNVKTTTHNGVSPSTINLKVTELKSSPATGQIAPGEANAKSDIKVDFKITSETNKTGAVNFKPNVTILYRGSQVWTGVVDVGQNKSVTASVTLKDMDFKFGNNKLEVIVNGDRLITEVVPGVSNPYADNSKSINFKGENPDLNNIKISNLNIYPVKSIIDVNKSSINENLKVQFDLTHQISATPGKTLLAPTVEIYIGGTRVYNNNEEIAQGSSSTRMIELGGFTLYQGNLPIQVVVNGNRFITEYSSITSNPYSDNVVSGVLPIVKYTGCDLPLRKNTNNTWTEQWVNTQYKGTINGGICRLDSVSTSVKTVNYYENYKITNIYFRSKYTKDMHAKGEPNYNALPSEGLGWVKVGTPGLLRVKGGYNFELISVTDYDTNRNRPEIWTIKKKPFNGIFGKGYSEVSSANISLSAVKTPTVVYLNMSDSTGANVGKFMHPFKKQGSWDNRTDYFRATQSTNFGAKSGKYDIIINTPRSDRPNSFMGYMAENPIGASSKTFLEDNIQFQIEVLGQDDLKSHIVQ